MSTFLTRERLGFWGGLVLFAVLLVLPPPEGLSVTGWRTAVVGLLMAVWWMTEAIPIAAASLVPLVAFPLLGVTTMTAAAAPYANPLIFLFLGGFLLALTLERWNLHRRLALGTIRIVGTAPRRIVAGFMVSAAFLSMWISNTATALMMLPIGLSLIDLLPAREDGEPRHFAICLMLGLAYSCSIGGLGTLIGTPGNALFAGFMQSTYGFDISFVGWMLVALPLVIVGMVLTYFVLLRLFPIQIAEIPGGRAFVDEEVRRLGGMTRPEKRVGAVFGVTALAWIFRPLLEELLPGLTDTGIAVAAGLVLFAIPAERGSREKLLDWGAAERLPWGVLLLFGGGLSLAAAISETGLAGWIGQALGTLDAWPTLLLTLAVVTVIVFLTELTSNTASTAAFLPVVASLALGIGENPLLLAVPVTIAASCAFMLPVATPPNAIVYGGSFVRIGQMAKAGAVLNVLFILLVTALAYTLLGPILGVVPGEVPDWAR